MVASPVFADYTTVYDTTHGTEWDLHMGLPTNPNWAALGGSQEGADDILDDLYGTGNYERIDDLLDEIWWDMDGGCEVTAKYSSDDHWLGYSVDEIGATNPVWLDPGDGQLDTVGETALFDIVPNSDNFVWVLGDGDTYYSLSALNGGCMDHMVSFRITNLVDTYAIAWENGGGDIDYQDMVYEVTNVVPEPATLCLFGLGALALLRKRRV